ncbi:MAG: threonine ammonia-lyase, biosynthetic [Gammaproteobacteria bacterium]|nr:threonine ammonia-lyase, biosynthetic [Gammaproteobacteria bacterium]
MGLTIAEYAQRSQNSHVYEVARETPLDRASQLSRRLNNNVVFKREDLQSVFSFKLRGAFNRIVQLDAASRKRGIVCSSAGNHAQGVALAAQRLGIKAMIVMPTTTPSIKVEAVTALGGEVVSHGDTYDDAYQQALDLAEQHGLIFIHPFDDPDVIAGQGTIGAEILRQLEKPPDAVFIPVGGGGLIAGVGAYLKHSQPSTRVVGVEPADAASMHTALLHGSPVTLDRVGIFADGVAVRRVGDETFRICQQVVDEIVLVTTDEICAAIKDIFEDSRVVMEPAGALAVAGLKRYLEDQPQHDKTFVTLNCGANVNFDRLRHIAERAEIGEHREALIAVEIPERPGAFKAFCEALGRRNVTEFNYRYAHRDRARVFVGVSLSRGVAEISELTKKLTDDGYQVLDLSNNELAKLHVRHMVGGPVQDLTDELICRFEFPERPGALLAFLLAIGERWNISLFHYRNHGSDYGRVLAGVQVAPADRAEFRDHLDTLGYSYWEETDNPAYQLFLGP